MSAIAATLRAFARGPSPSSRLKDDRGGVGVAMMTRVRTRQPRPRQSPLRLCNCALRQANQFVIRYIGAPAVSCGEQSREKLCHVNTPVRRTQD